MQYFHGIFSTILVEHGNIDRGFFNCNSSSWVRMRSSKIPNNALKRQLIENASKFYFTKSASLIPLLLLVNCQTEFFSNFGLPPYSNISKLRVGNTLKHCTSCMFYDGNRINRCFDYFVFGDSDDASRINRITLKILLNGWKTCECNFTIPPLRHYTTSSNLSNARKSSINRKQTLQ